VTCHESSQVGKINSTISRLDANDGIAFATSGMSQKKGKGKV